jgi:hypothetical protein
MPAVEPRSGTQLWNPALEARSDKDLPAGHFAPPTAPADSGWAGSTAPGQWATMPAAWPIARGIAAPYPANPLRRAGGQWANGPLCGPTPSPTLPLPQCGGRGRDLSAPDPIAGMTPPHVHRQLRQIDTAKFPASQAHRRNRPGSGLGSSPGQVPPTAGSPSRSRLPPSSPARPPRPGVSRQPGGMSRQRVSRQLPDGARPRTIRHSTPLPRTTFLTNALRPGPSTESSPGSSRGSSQEASSPGGATPAPPRRRRRPPRRSPTPRPPANSHGLWRQGPRDPVGLRGRDPALGLPEMGERGKAARGQHPASGWKRSQRCRMASRQHGISGNHGMEEIPGYRARDENSVACRARDHIIKCGGGLMSFQPAPHMT